ncbi:protein c14orf29 [Cystoisospora suis]|uniref:Protein c14orf29 n=1 Tax=Cystoisospora suis TaxID=483139 RepID=A0A2C6KZH5_9APIC|nr:protein c14orf29 [Cystoisospora suis]
MAIFSKVSEQYTELVNFIIRPPRDDSYTETDLGPPIFPLARRTYKRTDVVLINRRNQRLQCSHFEPINKHRSQEKLPCVVYLHGNCSSRVEALGTLPVLLPQGITVFAFDFAGSGKSDGAYVSLGWWEREDLDVVIEHLRASGTVSTIGLWGRSMGAVTALLHADRDPSIGGMILDSPFSSLRRLAEELASVVVAWRLPRFVLNSLLGMVRTTIINKAAFDINNLAPIDHVGHTFIPALFVVAKEDNFILPSHGEELFAKYAGDRNIVHVAGDHNSVRPRFLNDSAAIFFHTCLTLQALRASGRTSPVLRSPGNVDDVVGGSERIGERSGARRDMSEGRNLAGRSRFSSDFSSGVEPDASSSRHRNRSTPQMSRLANQLEFGEVPLIPGKASSQESVSHFSFPTVRLRSGDKEESSYTSHTSELQEQGCSTKGQDAGRSPSPSHQLLYGGVQLPRRSSLLVKPRSLWRRQGSDSSENPSDNNNSSRGTGYERQHENAARQASSRREGGSNNKADGSDPTLLLESSCRKGDGRKFANGLRMITKCSFVRGGSREDGGGQDERRRCEGPDDDSNFPPGAQTSVRGAGWPEGSSDDKRRGVGTSSRNQGEDEEGVGGGFGLLASTHELNDMRRPEAAWRFSPDEDGMVQLLASEGFSDDEDEIVQRAVALSLEEYLAARQNSLQDGARSSTSSLVSEDHPARFDSVAHHTSGPPASTTCNVEHSVNTVTAQDNASWRDDGKRESCCARNEALTDRVQGYQRSGTTDSRNGEGGVEADVTRSLDHYREHMSHRRPARNGSGSLAFSCGSPSTSPSVNASRSKGSNIDSKNSGGRTPSEPSDSHITSQRSPSTSSSSKLIGLKESSQENILRSNSRKETAYAAASPTSPSSASSPLEGGSAISSPMSQNTQARGGQATRDRQRSLGRASFSIPSFGLSFAKRRTGDQEDQGGK